MRNILFGNEVGRMPDLAFRMMKLLFIVFYFFNPADKKLKKFGIKPGSTIVDYGCGTGACIKAATELVGESGIVYAVDIHEMAIKAVEKLVKKYKMANVRSVLSDGNRSDIKDDTADLIYALDMFHMVQKPDLFLKELYRITKPDGVLIIEDGHQPRPISKGKILNSGVWNIVEENRGFLKCLPVKKNV